jgi:hypothetical protein
MPRSRPRYNKDEFARRGDAIYDRAISPSVKSERAGEFAAIDIESGEYEIDASELVASDKLRSRFPDAQIWLRRIGSRYARHFGPRAWHRFK